MMDEKTAIYCMMVDIDEKHCEDCPECGKMTDGEHCAKRAVKMAIKALEKQVPKSPILNMNVESPIFIDYADGHGECKMQKNNWWNCPSCGAVVGERRILRNNRIYDQKRKVYCDRCGQKLNWTGGLPK